MKLEIRDGREKFDLIELTKFIFKYKLNRKTFNSIFFEVHEAYNIYGCSEVFVRSKNTNAYLYQLYYGRPNGDSGDLMVKLFKLTQKGNKQEIYSINSDNLILDYGRIRRN